MSPELERLRAAIRDHHYVDEGALIATLLDQAKISVQARAKAQAEAAEFVRSARANAARSGLIDKFLQEYGLTSAEGVILMRLAEALLRTPDAATADALIRDKVEAGDWRAHAGRSPFPLVNFSTRALMLTAAWLDEIEGKDPTRRIARATKALLDRVGEPVIRASIGRAMKIMGEHFVLGETIADALRRARAYAERGYTFSYDMLGEAAYTAADAEKYFKDYADAIAAIGEHATADRPADNPGISVKLSALHPRYELSQRARVLAELGERAGALARAAKRARIGFNIDAEEASRLDLSLDLIETLARDPDLQNWEGFGVVVQAYQRRAAFVIDWLAALARSAGRRISVRLVKGAYWDGEIKRAQVGGFASYPVFTRKVLTDASYLACAKRLIDRADVFYPQFATHNALTAAMVREMAGPLKDYELQRLHGMGEALHDRLVEQGARSRIYAPVGGHRELLPYLVRRLLENGANSSFVNQLFDPDLSIDDVVADPLSEVSALTVMSNPAIPAPRDLFAGRRLSAQGFDLNDPHTIERLASAAAARRDDAAAPIIDGRTLDGAARDLSNPADQSERIGHVVEARREDVDAAVRAARAGAPAWGGTAPYIRADILRRAADLLEQRSEEFIARAVREAGKTIADGVAEVREAVDFLRYYADESTRLDGAPLGVVVCISPWNFPLAIFLGQIAGALAAGNAVIAKPAEQTPLIAAAAIKLMHEAGVPASALHFLPGDGPSIGAPLVAHPDIDGVVFTGSTAVAQAINRALAQNEREPTLIAETGGVNAMIVDSTALLEQAVSDAVSSAFQSAGQRCSATRLVCVQDEAADRFSSMLAGAMAELRVGDPSNPASDIGPVIDAEARAGILRHCAIMDQEARLIARAPLASNAASGLFVAPAAYELSSISQLKQEVFGPVLHVVRYPANGLGAVLDQINALGYGLTLGVHSRIDDVMHEVAARARIGNIYINRNQIGAVVGVQPFGGEGLSGTGPKAGGPHYLNALRRCERAPRSGAPTWNGSAISPAVVDRAEAAFNAAARLDFSDLLARAHTHAEVNAAAALLEASNLRNAHFSSVLNLPGPTGESNTLKLRGRGVVLCLGGGGEPENRRQVALALAAGNAVIGVGRLTAELSRALARAGLRDLVMEIPAGDPRSLFAAAALRAVVFDGAESAKRALREGLAARDGPICPLLSGQDPPWRFAAERTLTVNTTAAGGDVRLLSISE